MEKVKYCKILPKLELTYNEEKDVMELYASGKDFSKVLLGSDVPPFVEDRYIFLDKLLDGKLMCLCESISDVGYTANEYIYKDDVSGKITFDDLLRFHFCGTPGYSRPNLTTWIYKQGNSYYFEITPNYPYTYRDPEPGESYISFEDFMKNYKPLYKAAVTREELEELRNMFAKATIETYKNMYYDAMQALRETEACRHTMLAKTELK